MPTNNLGQALFLAVQHNRTSDIKKLLASRVPTNWQDPETGDTALHVAAERNEFDIARLLLDYDADATKKNHKNLTPINCASAAGFWDFVIKFAKRRKSTKDDNYGSALIDAARADQYDVVVALLRAGAPTTWHSVAEKNTSLHYAVINKNPAMVRALRTYLADGSAQNIFKKSPVELATEHYNETQDIDLVVAFTERVSYIVVNNKIIIEDIEDIIQTISTRKVNSYFQREDWAKKLSGKSSETRYGHYKDCILEQILELNDSALKQKALWQALDPSTFLGKFFRYQRGFLEPSINSGRLKKVVSALKDILKTNDGLIDFAVKDNIHHDPDVIKNFPQLLSKYPIYRVNQTVRDVAPATVAPDAWYKRAFGNSSENKKDAFYQISMISDGNLRQSALWQALDPNTYLGKIFHTKRGLFKPNYQSGFLKAICDLLLKLLSHEENAIVIAPNVRASLLRQPYIVKTFPQLKHAPSLSIVPNSHEEVKEEKREEPPPSYYSSLPQSGVPLMTIPRSSTALMMHSSADFIPNRSQETPGSHLLNVEQQRLDEVPSAPSSAAGSSVSSEMKSELETFLQSPIPNTSVEPVVKKDESRPVMVL